MLVHPIGRGQVGRVELTGPDQNRSQVTVHAVAVHPEAGERVVRTNRLTADRGRQRDTRVRVPETHVGQSRRGGTQLVGRHRGRPGEGRIGDLVESVGVTGRVDVARDVGHLERVLVGADLEGLQRRRVDHADYQRDKDPEPHRDGRQGPAARAHVGEQDHGRREGQEEQDRQGRHARVDVGVPGTLDVAVGRVDQLPLARDVPRGLDEGDRGAEHREVGFHPGRNPGTGAAQGDAAVQVMKDGRENQHREQHAEHPVQGEAHEGQGEDVEGHVLVEERVDAVELHAVREEFPVLPLGHGVQPGEKSPDRGEQRVSAAGVRAHHVLETAHDVVGLESHTTGAETIRQKEVAPRESEEDGPEGHQQADLHPEQGAEHPAKAESREPPQVGPEHGQVPKDQQQNEQGGHDAQRPTAAR